MALLFSGISSNGQNILVIPDTAVGPVINLTMDTSSITFYNSPTKTMGFNGDILGPTLFLEQGDSVQINVINDLDDTTTVHWHGLHVSPENDGGPHSTIAPGATWSKNIKVLDHAATYWYHPHLHEHTNEHVTKGLSGFIIVRDSSEAALNLPRDYGVDDFPIVVQSRDFDVGDQFLLGTAMDTAILVNGTLDPYVNLPAQVVRLRLLNGSSERSYNFGFSDGRSFQMIASDGGLLAAPVSMNRLRLAPGERGEILVDLQGDSGKTIQLRNFGSGIPSGIYGAAQPGMGMGQSIPGYANNLLNGSDFDLLQINVISPTTNPVTTIPVSLVNVQPWLESSADTTRTLTFTPQTMGPTAIQGPFEINGSFFDMNVINQVIPLGNIEVWRLVNQSPIAHPFHIHDVQFYILDKGGVAPPSHEQGRKDVVLVEPMTTVRFITRFDDFSSDTMPYMYHCHMLPHEDDGMMHQFLVVDTISTNLGRDLFGNKNLTVFPNPVNGHFLEISWPVPIRSAGEASIIDQSGKKLSFAQIETGATKVHFNVSNLSRGVYMIMIALEGQYLAKKFIRQ